MPGRIRNVVHIKHRTAGTSNELSFDVLEAKKVAADAGGRPERRRSGSFGAKSLDKGRRKSTLGSLGRGEDVPTTLPKLYTNDAAQAAKNIERAALPYGDPTAEIQRRKRRRPRNRAFTAVAALAVAVAVVAFASSQVSRYLADQTDTELLLSQALEAVQKVDETVVEMDQLVVQPTADQSQEELDDLVARLDDASAALKGARSQAESASNRLLNARERDAANQTVTAITARLELIQDGKRLLQDRKAAAQASKDMSNAWILILQADTLATEAGNLVANTTEENVTASMEKTNVAIDKFRDAQKLVQKVQRNYPAANVSAYATYLEKRLEGQQAALDSDAAILLKDRDSANRYNQQLYDCDSQAATIAQNFPRDPAQGVMDSYRANSEDLRDKYIRARSQASSADAYLRDYLGTAGK